MAFDMSKAAYGKASVSKLDRVQHIRLGQIDRNETNFYSVEGIEELAESIKTVGLLDPVRVVPAEGGKAQRYRLISGHRRFEAYLYLLRETVEARWEKIPALVMEDVDDLTETFALITANSTARELTYAEKCRQEQLLRETLLAMKAAGREVPKNLGQYMAEQLGTSRNEVSRMHSVNENLIPEAREKLDRGEMTAHRAYELSRRPEAEQRAEVKPAAKAQRGRDAAGDLESANRALNIMKFARLMLEYFAPSAHTGLSRSECVFYLKDRFQNAGSWTSDRRRHYSSAAGKITMEHYRVTATFAELWDALAIAALERVSELGAEEAGDPKTPSLWHAADETPKQDGSYVCLYRGPVGDSPTPRSMVMEYRERAWRLHGNKVEGVYTVLRWTEVPEC